MTLLGALMGFFLLSGAAFALPVQASAPAVVRPTYTVTLTGYNAVPEQTDDTPFETASGAYTNTEIIAARSRDLADELPFGTIIAIEGPATKQENCGYHVVAPVIGYRIIEDTMNARYTDRIDVLFDTNAKYVTADGRRENAGMIVGICKGITIRVVGRLDKSTMKMPKTQKELAALVIGTSNKLVLK